MAASNPGAIRVLHVGEAAGTAAALVAEARSQGLPWTHLPLASEVREWNGARAKTERALRGVAWLATLKVQARRADIVHVHSASTYGHSRFGAKRFVLHCHGSDVRSGQYQPGIGTHIREALRVAETVVYSTPDLAEHVLNTRPDARYLPVPIATADLPTWHPPERPRIVFASRWEQVKGLERQVETARALSREFGSDVELLGLDWGPDADQAKDAGVRLVPRMSHDQYLAWLACSTAVVGQAAGILSASELEALGSGVPLLVPAPLPLYATDAPPVLGNSVESVLDHVSRLLESGVFDPAQGREWVQRVHGVSGRVDTLMDIYRDVLVRR